MMDFKVGMSFAVFERRLASAELAMHVGAFNYVFPNFG